MTSHNPDTLGIVVRGVSAIVQAVFCTVLTPEERINQCGIEFEARKPSEILAAFLHLWKVQKSIDKYAKVRYNVYRIENKTKTIRKHLWL